jgi:hypothetical protein
MRNQDDTPPRPWGGRRRCCMSIEVVNLALVREFRYEYAAVSPWDGCLDYMTAEKIWNTFRRDYFANRVFDSLDAAAAQAEKGLAEMAIKKEAMRRLTNWPWISAILKT